MSGSSIKNFQQNEGVAGRMSEVLSAAPIAPFADILPFHYIEGIKSSCRRAGQRPYCVFSSGLG
jgi:hypothetical protein